MIAGIEDDGTSADLFRGNDKESGMVKAGCRLWWYGDCRLSLQEGMTMRVVVVVVVVEYENYKKTTRYL